jgi:flagellar basal-body rod protein FlgB
MTMDEAALRHQAIASNIANVNTPGYKRVDVGSNFESAFNDAINRISQGESVSMDDMPDQTIETAANQGPARPDGNTVQVEQEMVSMAQNSARYEFAGQLLAQNFHGIKTAITGQS